MDKLKAAWKKLPVWLKKRKAAVKTEKKEMLALLCASLLLVGTFFLFGPMNLFLNNQNDLEFTILDWVPYVLLYGLGALLALMAVGTLLPKKGLMILTAAVFAFGIGVYLQGNFLNVSYGELDGRGIQWS